MTPEIILLSATLVALMLVLITLMATILKSLASLTKALQDLKDLLSPVAQDLQRNSYRLAQGVEALRAARVIVPFGGAEQEQSAIKGGLLALIGLAWPWALQRFRRRKG